MPGICTLLACCCTGALVATGVAQAQHVLKQYEARASHFTAEQPHWAGPVITTVPMLVQVVRYDVQRALPPSGAVWNLGTAKGVQFVPAPHLEFTVSLPNYIERDGPAANGWADMAVAAKYRVAAAPESAGNYIVTALLTATLPTGTNGNGQTDAALSPSLIAGKGFGRFDVVASVGGSLPTSNVEAYGRTVTTNAALQYHLARYVWPEIESNTTHWFGSSRDGHTQSFVMPGIVFGRMPYTAHERDRRRGWSVGAALQIAATPFHTYDHNLVFTTRVHF